MQKKCLQIWPIAEIKITPQSYSVQYRFLYVRMGRIDRGGGLYLFDEADETPAEAPRLVPITLQRADSDLLRLLHRHRHHVHGVVHQRRVRLHDGAERREGSGWRHYD